MVAGLGRSSSVWPLLTEDPGQGGLYPQPSASELLSLTSVISRSESDSGSGLPSGCSTLSLLTAPAAPSSPLTLRGSGCELRLAHSLCGIPGKRLVDLSSDSPGSRETGGGSWESELG